MLSLKGDSKPEVKLGKMEMKLARLAQVRGLAVASRHLATTFAGTAGGWFSRGGRVFDEDWPDLAAGARIWRQAPERPDDRNFLGSR